MSERTEDAEARREELALAVTAGMNEEEKKIFEDETLGLTLEEKLAYRKMSRGKRRVLKKIAETRRRKGGTAAGKRKKGGRGDGKTGKAARIRPQS